MAIYSPSPLVGAISGAVGGTVFVNAKGSKVVRHRPQKTTPDQRQFSPLIGSPQSALQICARYWRTMTDAERAAWRTLASTTPATNRLGKQRPLTGFQLFLKWNLSTWIGAGQPRADAPQDGTVDNLSTFDLDFADGGPFNVDWDYISGTNAQAFIIYGRVLYSTVVPKFHGHLRQIGLYINTGGPDTEDIYDDWIAVLPEPTEGQAVIVAVRSFAGTYLPSPFLTKGTIVTA